jgi:hypothetical protein
MGYMSGLVSEQQRKTVLGLKLPFATKIASRADISKTQQSYRHGRRRLRDFTIHLALKVRYFALDVLGNYLGVWVPSARNGHINTW